jgi:hypothetical protein
MKLLTRFFHKSACLVALITLSAMLLAACGAQNSSPTAPSVATSPQTTAAPTPSGPTGLKYLLLGKYAANNNLLYCDRDKFPLELAPEEEQRRAEAKLPEIQADQEKYQSILGNVGLNGTATLSPEQALLVYRESKRLDAIQMEPEGSGYRFAINAGNQADMTEGAGTKYSGLIDGSGNVTGEKKEPVNVQCPICLSGDTLISTPSGPVRVRDMIQGMPVWTLDKRGNRVEARVIKTVKRVVAVPYEMVRLALDDGRELYAASRHPLMGGTFLGMLEAGGTLDNARIISVERVSYAGAEGATYDILPSGETGFYWANGIPLASTLTPTQPGQR